MRRARAVTYSVVLGGYVAGVVALYLVVTCGVVVVLSALAVPGPVGPGMILPVGPAALVGTGWLLLLQRRHAHA